MRKALTLSIKTAVSGLLLYFTLAAVNIGTVTSRLSHIDAQWAVLGLFFLVVQLAALAWRWRLLVAYCGADLPFARLFRLSMIGVFFNQTLPSSAGGDAMRIWLLGKQSTWRIAAYSVLLDRVIGVVALAILVVFCLPWTLGSREQPGWTRRTTFDRMRVYSSRNCLRDFVLATIAVPSAMVANTAPRCRSQHRFVDSSFAVVPYRGLWLVDNCSFAHRARGLVCRTRGRCRPTTALFVVFSVTGRLANRHPNFNRRLGRSRKCNGRRFRLCRAGPKRRIDRFFAVRIWIFSAWHRRRVSLGAD